MMHQVNQIGLFTYKMQCILSLEYNQLVHLSKPNPKSIFSVGEAKKFTCINQEFFSRQWKQYWTDAVWDNIADLARVKPMSPSWHFVTLSTESIKTVWLVGNWFRSAFSYVRGTCRLWNIDYLLTNLCTFMWCVRMRWLCLWNTVLTVQLKRLPSKVSPSLSFVVTWKTSWRPSTSCTNVMLCTVISKVFDAVFFNVLLCSVLKSRLIPRTLGSSSDFTLLNSCICLHGVLD